MSYRYSDLREQVFTDEGQRLFLQIHARVRFLLGEAGAFTMEAAIRGRTGDSWMMLACVDRLVELDEIVEIDPDIPRWAQRRVFIRKET